MLFEISSHLTRPLVCLSRTEARVTSTEAGQDEVSTVSEPYFLHGKEADTIISLNNGWTRKRPTDPGQQIRQLLKGDDNGS